VNQLPVNSCFDDAAPLPVANFLTVTLIYLVVLVRRDGLTVGQALLDLVGLRRRARGGRDYIFAAVAIIPTLALMLWLSAECRAALT
jgi:hypothetical protein